jgi:O-antigen ligase
MGWPVLIAIAFAGTALWSSSPLITLAKAMAWLGLALLTVHASTARGNRSRRAVGAMVQSIVSVFLVLEVVSVLAGGGIIVPATTGIGQVAPTLLPVHPNTFALVLVVAAAAALAGLLGPWSPRLVLLMASLLGLVMLTRSRTALAVLAVVWALQIILGRRGRLTVSLVLGVGIAGAVLATGQVVDFLLRGQTQSDVLALSGRTPLWDAAIRAIHERPWTGYGYGVGPAEAVEKFSQTYLAYTVNTVDNMYLDLLVAGGVLLLVPWGAWLLTYGGRLLSFWRGNSDLELRLFMMSLASILIARSVAGSGFDVLGTWELLFILSWCLTARDRGRSRPSSPGMDRARLVRS